MKRLLLLPLLSTFCFIGCDAEPSVASRSHAAYREATARGETVGEGHDHGGHEGAGATGTAAHPEGEADHAMDHAAASDHAAMGHGTAPAEGHDAGKAHAAGDGAAPVDHAAMGHARSSNAADHGAHAATRSAGIDHGAHATRAPSAPSTHAAHEAAAASPASTHAAHSKERPPATAPSAHSAHQAPPTPGHEMHVAAPRAQTDPPRAPQTSREIGSIAPAATLAPDPLDAPVPISVAEAEKAERASEQGHDGHAAPAPASPASPPPPDHGGHATPPKKD